MPENTLEFVEIKYIPKNILSFIVAARISQLLKNLTLKGQFLKYSVLRPQQ